MDLVFTDDYNPPNHLKKSEIWRDMMKKQMKIEEAILYCLASQNRGMRTEQIAEMINRQRLHIRKDGQPVTSNQVYAVICRYPDMFVKAEGRIMLMI